MFGGNFRSKKILEMCRDDKRKPEPRVDNNFWAKKKSNWFCNRDYLSPKPVGNPEEVRNDSETQEQHYIQPNKKIIVQQIITIKPPCDTLGNKEISKIETIPDTEEFSNINSDLEKEDQFYKEDSPVSTPEDPFGGSTSEEYSPSNEEGNSSSDDEQNTHRVTKRSKRRINKSKNLDIAISITENDKLGASIVETQATEYNRELPLPNKQLTYYDLPESTEIFNDHQQIDTNRQVIVTEPTEFPNHQQHQARRAANRKESYKRKLDFCFVCDTPVQNFARHIKRNHSTQIEVVEIFSKPAKSKERRVLLDKLRRKGNFVGSSGGTCFKPVRESDLPNRSLLPCNNCLGFFSAKLLYRHRNKCHTEKKERSAQSAGHNTLLRNIKVDKRLKDEVFPHMRVDKVSMEAKQDVLICAFGSRYLNIHREKHFVQVTSRKMRELAKILIEIKKLEPSITDLFSALQPKYFDHFVESTKRIAKYDADKDIYYSPTFAMNIATSLKQCCDIAITYAYKKQGPYLNVATGVIEADLKTLIHLFESNWKFEVSSQAANNLSLNKWNKITVIPLASDLKLLRDYLIQLAENTIKNIEGDTTVEAYNILMESVYCRVILLNRKRSGELQRMLVHTYYSQTSNKQEYEEFNKIISPTEKILLKALKRIVIRGKRGRGVPVLFSTDVQNHIKTLLQIRDQFVPKENPYLFAKPNSLSHIIGYKILSKHAKNCGAKNPSSITSTRLRKHLATLSQLFSLSENEIEQLATFMGHTPGVHRNSYRLPDDVYQTSKISKLLLIMEKGCANEFKGKSLDEIDLNMDENLLEIPDRSDESDCDELSYENTNNIQHLLISSTSQNVAERSPVSENVANSGLKAQKKKRILVPWTNEQKSVVKLFFQNHIRAFKPPKKSECKELKSKYPDLLKNKEWFKIKVFIQNEYNKGK